MNWNAYNRQLKQDFGRDLVLCAGVMPTILQSVTNNLITHKGRLALPVGAYPGPSGGVTTFPTGLGLVCRSPEAFGGATTNGIRGRAEDCMESGQTLT